MSLGERTFICPNCSYTNDRDVTSAIVIEQKTFKINIPKEIRNAKAMLLEVKTADILSNERLSSLINERRSLALYGNGISLMNS